MNFKLINRIAVGIAGSLALVTSMAANAAYPDKPIHIYVPFAPGGAGDVILRIVTQKLGESWGQPIVVEYKPGADTQIGADAVAKAAPDGYTLGLFTPTIVVNKFLYTKSPYDLQKDLRPVATFARAPGVLLVNPALEAKDLKEFIALGKRSDRMNYSSSSAIGLVMVESFNRAVDIKATNIPYKGSSPSVTAVMAGDVQYTIDTIPMAKQQVAAGKLRALGVTAKTRSPEAPSIPTLEEAGLPGGFEFMTWYGLLAPAGVPDDIVNKFNAEINRIIALPETQKKIEAMGALTFPQTSEAFGNMLKADLARYGTVIKEAKLAPLN